MANKNRTSNALEIIDHLVGDDVELRGMIEEEQVNATVAREIHQLRTSRGLTQKQLAERVGTTQSAIARLEEGAAGGIGDGARGPRVARITGWGDRMCEWAGLEEWG